LWSAAGAVGARDARRLMEMAINHLVEEEAPEAFSVFPTTK
jgi:hypothetical protein